MKALVLGAGRMGRAAAWDLLRQPGAELVTLADRDPAALAAAVATLESERRRLGLTGRVASLALDLDQPVDLAERLRGFHVVLSSADYRFNAALTRAAIAAGVHLCDLGGNLFVVEEQLGLDEAARAAGVTVVPDCGLAPGLAGWLGAWAVGRLDRAEALTLRVGGLPAHPRPPLNYKIVFSVRGLVNEYLEPAEVLRAGEVVRVPSLTEVEPVDFPPPFGRLEAFHTSGGVSTLVHSLRGQVPDLDYKTLRYPGHAAVFASMAWLGLLGDGPVLGVSPRELTEALLERALTDDDTDVVLLRVTATGWRGGQRGRLVLELIDHHDPVTGHSAMARATAYPAALVAHWLATGRVQARGVLPGERCLPLDELVPALRARGLALEERWEA